MRFCLRPIQHHIRHIKAISGNSKGPPPDGLPRLPRPGTVVAPGDATQTDEVQRLATAALAELGVTLVAVSPQVVPAGPPGRGVPAAGHRADRPVQPARPGPGRGDRRPGPAGGQMAPRREARDPSPVDIRPARPILYFVDRFYRF